MLKSILKGQSFQNLVYLSLFQGVNFLAIIIFVPYLTKKVGVELYGTLTIVQAICLFFYVFVEYGFSLTTVRKLSVNRGNLSVVKEIISSTLEVKLVLVVVALPFFILISFLFLKGHGQLDFIFLSFFAVLGQAVFPTWLCQGLDETKLLFIANLINKVILCCLVFFQINEQDDYIYYLFFMGLASFITGIVLTWYIVIYKLKMVLNFQFSGREILRELNEGKEVFFSNFSISVFLSSNVLILSLFASSYAVGVYSIAERIMMFLRTALSVFVQALYPLVCRWVAQIAFKKVVSQVLRFSIPFSVLIGIVGILMFFYSVEISSLFTDNNVTELSAVLRKLSFLPFLVSLNTAPNLIILASGKEKTKSYILLVSTGISFGLSFLTVPYFKVDGTVFVMYFVELFVAITTIYYLIKLNKSIVR